MTKPGQRPHTCSWQYEQNHAPNDEHTPIPEAARTCTNTSTKSGHFSLVIKSGWQVSKHDYLGLDGFLSPVASLNTDKTNTDLQVQYGSILYRCKCQKWTIFACSLVIKSEWRVSKHDYLGLDGFLSPAASLNTDKTNTDLQAQYGSMGFVPRPENDSKRDRPRNTCMWSAHARRIKSSVLITNKHVNHKYHKTALIKQTQHIWNNYISHKTYRKNVRAIWHISVLKKKWIKKKKKEMYNLLLVEIS
jgi:hypothetical protein